MFDSYFFVLESKSQYWSSYISIWGLILFLLMTVFRSTQKLTKIIRISLLSWIMIKSTNQIDSLLTMQSTHIHLLNPINPETTFFSAIFSSNLVSDLSVANEFDHFASSLPWYFVFSASIDWCFDCYMQHSVPLVNIMRHQHPVGRFLQTCNGLQTLGRWIN